MRPRWDELNEAFEQGNRLPDIGLEGPELFDCLAFLPSIKIRRSQDALSQKKQRVWGRT
jgi:hypothetical protein